uniref:Uncharacterized protein n=1 Tax=Oryza sativa subsp. japonica TaxID=39947 RepID=Q651J7_ORYSJ|nr:hypothetical protein [Oryza sativa Japonica Group]BAD46520.1 hypothetical protein [Oryza sativa Japonica Group]
MTVAATATCEGSRATSGGVRVEHCQRRQAARGWSDGGVSGGKPARQRACRRSGVGVSVSASAAATRHQPCVR